MKKKTKHHLRNWKQYNQSLRTRGSLTFWISEDLIDNWLTTEKTGSLSTHQPIDGDDLRALRAWFREREKRADANSSYLFFSERGPFTRQAVNYLVEQIAKRDDFNFKVTPHTLRHSTGYYLANKGYDTRLVQGYLDHRNITHTVRYTRTAASRFDGLWR